MGDDTRLRYGIAGLGPGAMSLLDGFARSPYARLAAAADVRTEALAAFGREYGVETFTSVEEMCRGAEIDAVWIVTPTHLHTEHAIAAAAHGKHIIVSKPMAVTLEDCDAMIDAAAKHGVKLLCGHTQALLPTVRAMTALVRGGDLGRLGMVHTWHYTDWMERPRMPYELDEAQGGGVVFRQSPHQVDIVRHIGGGLVRGVRAMTLQINHGRPALGAYVAYLEFADGTPATLVYSGYGHFNIGELTGAQWFMASTAAREAGAGDEAAWKESWRYTDTTSRRRSTAQAGGARHAPFGLTLISCERADLRESPDGLLIYDEGGRKEVAVPAGEARGEAELEELYHTVVEGRPLVHDGRWGKAGQEVTLAIRESARTGREMLLSAQVALPG